MNLHEALNLFRWRILEAVDKPETGDEMRKIAKILKIDLERIRRLVVEWDLCQAARGFGSDMERIGDSIGNSIVF